MKPVGQKNNNNIKKNKKKQKTKTNLFKMAILSNLVLTKITKNFTQTLLLCGGHYLPTFESGEEEVKFEFVQKTTSHFQISKLNEIYIYYS